MMVMLMLMLLMVLLMMVMLMLMLMMVLMMLLMGCCAEVLHEPRTLSAIAPLATALLSFLRKSRAHA